ncbi:hypothetical protein Ga0466249_000969 [Sporomusaceae bacterium BoRhaA]|nr:hypothetical protein [Pelorhabdus rhamnosifermentans]
MVFILMVEICYNNYTGVIAATVPVVARQLKADEKTRAIDGAANSYQIFRKEF